MSRVRTILKNFPELLANIRDKKEAAGEFLSYIKETFGIDIEQDSDETLKEKLRTVKRLTPEGTTDWGAYAHMRIQAQWPQAA